MNTKKPLSILLTLCMIVGLAPWSVLPARADATPVTEIEVADWAALKGNSSAATVTTVNGVTTITLNACIKLTAKLEIAFGEASERPYVLDLNGYGIRYAGENGSVIAPFWRCSSLTLKDSTPGRATYYITLTDGRGTAVSDGAPSGTEGTDYLTVDGGYITGGSVSTGGGIYFTSPFTMEGGTICGNKAKSSGGVRASNFTMSGGAISYNSATSDAGGVNISTKGTAVMTGGTIAHNSGPVSDVNNSGTFVMTGGTIGYEGQSGKSICNTPYSAFYSKSGSSARCYGNFEVDYGKPAQTISTVTASAANGTVAVSSDPAWTDETTGYYAERDTVTLTVTPDAGYQLDTLTVKDASSNNVEVGGTGNTRTFTMPGSNVTVSATFAALPVAQVNETPYTSVQDAINAASSDYENSPGTVTLLANVTVDEPLTIESGRYVTLD
ncbi:MAG: hypothetical protein E7422_07125, partial [Ruminococcaceae bacterium]|nr:hypothetical protein [Oscillospiraceae bacterium]